jgi:hypothetical protein
MVITRKVLNEIIKDEYEKLLTEAVEEAVHLEEGQLEEVSTDSIKAALPYVFSAMSIGTVLTALSMNQMQAVDLMLTVGSSPQFDARQFEPYLSPQEKEVLNNQKLSPEGNEAAYKMFMAGPAIRIAKEGKFAELSGEQKIPVIKAQAPKTGPAKPVVPAAKQKSSPTGTTNVKRMEEREFPKPKSAAPSKLG